MLSGAARPGESLSLAAAVGAPQAAQRGEDAALVAGLSAPCGIPLSADAEAAFAVADVVIDFSRPEATALHAALAGRMRKPLVVGTTGLGPAEHRALDEAARTTAILHAANMSLGVVLLAALVEQAAARLGEDFDIEIFEAHHRDKRDAPSGTALFLAEAATKSRRDAMIAPPYHGQAPRQPGQIGISVLRGGDIVGEHTVTFAGPGERLDISHKASDRAIFARGALKAARWLAGQPPGRYDLRDMLRL